MKKAMLLHLLLIAAIITVAQSKTDTYLQTAIDNIESKCINWRRDLHQHPELGNQEFRTAGIIAKHLRSLGLDVQENVAKTGVVGILRGQKPGPVIGLRADMDALPVTERNNLGFRVRKRYPLWVHK